MKWGVFKRIAILAALALAMGACAPAPDENDGSYGVERGGGN